MRLALLAVLGVLVGSAIQAPAPARVPILVELFTSEGCSSCPPADRLLSRLAQEQPVPGVQVIPLGLHVTYWDQLGWKDPASLDLATRRQHDYSRVFGEDRVYTPQAVVDGRNELVGSDESGMKRAIATAAKQAHARIAVTAMPGGPLPGWQVIVAGVPAEAKEPLEVVEFVTENGLTSVVRRGENGGRTLRHDAVVRWLDSYSCPRNKAGVLEQTSVRAFPNALPREWRRENLTLVITLQEQKSRRIWGAASLPLK
jgi:hypothetical protein